MGFQEILDLTADADKTYRLGGVDKKTKKKNPEQVEGYFLGTRKIESAKSQTGFSSLHFFQTADGNHAVWGKTDLDSKLKSVPAGTMVRVTFTGMVETRNNPMYKYRVEVDAENTIDVGALDSDGGTVNEDATGDVEDGNDSEESAVDDDESQPDEVAPQRATPPARRAQAPTPEQRARVQSLLNGNVRK